MKSQNQSDCSEHPDVYTIINLEKEILDYVKTNFAKNTFAIYRNTFKQFIHYIGNIEIACITIRDIENFKAYSVGRDKDKPKPQWPFSMSLRTKEWTYIMNQRGLDELYNRINDPKEQNNIIENRPFIAQKMKEELEDFIALTSEGKPQVTEEVHIDEELKEQLKSLGYLR